MHNTKKNVIAKLQEEYMYKDLVNYYISMSHHSEFKETSTSDQARDGRMISLKSQQNLDKTILTWIESAKIFRGLLKYEPSSTYFFFSCYNNVVMG